MNEQFFIFNKEYYPSGTPVVTPANRSLRYGDGLFETMRMEQGKIVNSDFHFERLFAAMKWLQMDIPGFFSKDYFFHSVNGLLSRNSIHQNARIRLMFFRGEEGIFEIKNNSINFIIETFPLAGDFKLNEEGLAVDLFTDAAKSCDRFSNLKSNNYLPSVMAARFSRKNNLDEAILLNAFGRICESSISNVFIIKEKKLYTPPLSEGCVAGTMRRWMLEKLKMDLYVVHQKALTIEDLLAAEEFFLTNAIQPVRWVRQFRDKTYGNRRVKEIFTYFTERK